MSDSESSHLTGWVRDPAKTYVRLFHKASEDKIAAFKGFRCAVCWPITTGLCVFSCNPEFLKPDQEAIVDWPIMLSELVNTAEAGCQLCRFMAVNFFFRSST
jgi:hypothetical protein